VQFQDSLGMVLLKSGDLSGALKAYNAAVQGWPLEDDSLFGRALVRQRLGDKAGAARDLEAARALDVRIDEVFADYGEKAQP
jgi:Flp pilus assembly protein TadD